MKRVHVLEFEDLEICPGWLRDCLTRQIRVMCLAMGFDQAVASVLRTVLQSSSRPEVLDLGSGAGGIMPEVLGAVQRGEDGVASATMTLSDRFPNAAAIDAITALGVDGLSYHPAPVDATQLEQAPHGVKTMVNSFHHLRPAEARSVLASAYAAKTPVLIYELADNRLPFWLWLVTLPLGLFVTFVISLLLTPFVKPLTVRQLLFTYVIPLSPMLYAWDGQASYPRVYGPADVEALTEGLDDGYTWTTGAGTNDRGKEVGFYLLGMPREASPAEG